MGLFYFIAGYFTPRPYDRKGAWRFLADRLVRLGVPLLFYALIINPLVTYWASVAGGYVGSFWQFATSHTQDLTKASVGPLWFVEGLLIFSIVYALGRLAFSRTGGRDVQPGVTPEPGNMAIAIFALAIGLATFVVRFWAKVGWQWEPAHLELAHFPQYIAMFAAGILFYRRGWLAAVLERQARIWVWVTLACVLLLPLLAVAAGALEDRIDPAMAGGISWLSLAYSLWEGFMCVAMSLTALALFRRRFNWQDKLARIMAADSYAVYVLHPLIIVPLAILFSDITWPLELMFLLVAPLGVALCFLIAHAVRQLPLVRQVL
jgi:glucan biosynthesis protein C